MQDDEFEIDAEAAENRARQAGAEEDDAISGAKADSKLEKLKKELADVKQEKQENLDGWQRAKADYVNILKRFEEEKKMEKIRGIEKAIETLLPAFDALERAKEHGEVPAGFQAIAKQLESSFATLGLESVAKVGDAFDPNVHEAYGQDAAASKGDDDTITAVLEQGYKIGERVVRAAKVKVAHWQG